MPAKSIKSRKMFAIAEHHPDELYARNRGVLDMSHEQLHDFASTSEKGLPEKKSGFRKAARKKRRSSS